MAVRSKVKKDVYKGFLFGFKEKVDILSLL